MECQHWEPGAETADCHLCPWQCHVKVDQVGICQVRKNVGGTLRSLNYGRVTSIGVDPIEKKPLYHFFPGSTILSLGTFGCNLSCAFCQNWQISKGTPPSDEVPPEQAARMAEQYQTSHGNLGIAYTYNEPFIWYEYVQDTARLIRDLGMKNVLVTNGMVEKEPLLELLPLIDAMNVDIKFWSRKLYTELCGGPGWRARETVELATGKCHVEITVLIIPGYNDTDEELGNIFAWAADVDPNMAVHLSRYHPAYKLSAPPTPPETMLHAYDLARQRLNYVYLGNVHLPGTTDTECAECGAVLVERSDYRGVPLGVNREGRCKSCGAEAPIRS
ncbi:MAG: AmmeMemoRadiSam system radical SAM enzyme [candidate division WS1 bacterium]|nr:AmmeMemoRadiSam system radical SAM enzyme [candidate division WS1 bacterium]